MQDSFGALTEEETQLAEMERLFRTDWTNRFALEGREKWLYERELRAAEREKQEIEVKMTGGPRFELRGRVAEALEVLRNAD